MSAIPRMHEAQDQAAAQRMAPACTAASPQQEPTKQHAAFATAPDAPGCERCPAASQSSNNTTQKLATCILSQWQSCRAWQTPSSFLDAQSRSSPCSAAHIKFGHEVCLQLKSLVKQLCLELQVRVLPPCLQHCSSGRDGCRLCLQHLLWGHAWIPQHGLDIKELQQRLGRLLEELAGSFDNGVPGPCGKRVCVSWASLCGGGCV